jgi:hypothetical protein
MRRRDFIRAIVSQPSNGELRLREQQKSRASPGLTALLWMYRRETPSANVRRGVRADTGTMFGLKRKVKFWRESFKAGASNTGSVSATVSGKLVLNWHGTPTQRDDLLRTFPVLVRDKLMPGVELGNCADAIIASIHDDGMSSDNLGSNIQSLAMLWRVFTTRLDDGTYGDLIAHSNLHAAFELHEQPNDQFKVTWNISVMRGRSDHAKSGAGSVDGGAKHTRPTASERAPGFGLGVSNRGRGAMTAPPQLEGVPISRLIDTRHELTALIKQNLYGGGSKDEGRAALIARNQLDDFVFHMTDDAITRGNVADLAPLKRAIILETYTELLDILDDYSRRFGRRGKAAKQGMLAVLSDPDVFGRFNADQQARIQAIAAGISLLAKRRLHRLHLSIRTEAGKFI